MKTHKAPSGMAGVMSDVARSRQRVVIVLEDGTKAALVPVEDLGLLEALEDREDIQAAQQALAEPGTVAWQKVKEDLAL